MPAELFQFPPRRPSSDGDVPPDAVALLRHLAKLEAEAGADPSTLAPADLALLLVCDTLLMLSRNLAEAEVEWGEAPFEDHQRLSEECKRRQRALKAPMILAAKLRATTPVGLFAKAAAVRRIGPGAVRLAVSLAADLLASPELRAAVWPANDRK